ncbi:MAG TPA: hypothetical protein VJU61_07590 [Polyangiaceae bacterium]|nr:hypothetical protein [Polyangiaceae bacterium]
MPPPRVKASYLYSEASQFHGRPGVSEGALALNASLLLRSANDGEITCQMVSEPSWGANHAAIYLRQREAGWELVARTAIASLYGSLDLRLAKGMALTSAVDSLQDCIEESVRPLSASLAGVLHRAWTEMLLRARPRAMVAPDPDSSAHWFAHHHLAGMTLSGDTETSLTGKLVDLGKRLLGAATLRGAKHQAALDDVGAQALALLNEVSRLPDPEPDKTSWAVRKLYGEPDRP